MRYKWQISTKKMFNIFIHQANANEDYDGLLLYTKKERLK